jgi:hypothetical protein
MMRTAPLSKASGGGSRSSVTLAPAAWALAEGNALEWKHSPSTRQRGGERMRGRAFVEGRRRRRSDLLDVGLRCRLRNQRDLKEWLILRAARVRQSALRRSRHGNRVKQSGKPSFERAALGRRSSAHRNPTAGLQVPRNTLFASGPSSPSIFHLYTLTFSPASPCVTEQRHAEHIADGGS